MRMRTLTLFLALVLLGGCGRPSGVVPLPTPSPVEPTPIAIPSVSPTAAIALPSTAELSAPSRDVVWALIAGELFRSLDGGNTWRQTTTPPVRNNAVSFANANEGWVLATGSPATQCMQQPATIWHTADAGATWQDLGAGGIAARQCKSWISFIDTRHGFVSAWDPNTPAIIYATTDGGLSWTASAPLPDPPGQTTAGSVSSLVASRVGRADGRLYVAASGWQQSYVYVSDNGGANWSHLVKLPNAATMASMSFVDARHWWLSAEGGTRVTSDGGVTWRPSTGPQFAAPIAPVITFADSSVGYATVRGGIQRTNDGGATWTAIRTPGT